MKLGMLGSGRMGAKLGRLWAACGHAVSFAYSRGPAKLARLARQSGGDEGAKAVAGSLIRDIGFAPLAAGARRNARSIEPFAMVTAELAYAQPGGPALTTRFERLRG
jgi:predicted dinucleotide-binding enzyme